ncbi:transposase, Ptta/En/Spm, plant, partial [Tanacetum coccineum]
VERLEELSDPRVTQEIKWLARGPNNFVRRYSDKFGITLVNFSYLTHSGSDIHDDPFVFASQVEKVFYAKDPQLENSLYLIPDTCDVPSLYRNEVDGDDEIDVTESMEDEDEEEEDTY